MSKHHSLEDAFLCALFVVIMFFAVLPMAVLLHFWTLPSGPVGAMLAFCISMPIGIPLMVLSWAGMLRLGKKLGVLR